MVEYNYKSEKRREGNPFLDAWCNGLNVFFLFVAFTFLCSKTRSAAPHTPRVILLGPTGAGKGVQAALVANKYNIVNG